MTDLRKFTHSVLEDAASPLAVVAYVVEVVRPIVLKKLAELRAAKQIGSALETYVLWELNDMDYVTLGLAFDRGGQIGLRDQLAEIFGVSQVFVYANGDLPMEVTAFPTGAIVGDNLEKVEVILDSMKQMAWLAQQKSDAAMDGLR